LAAKAWFHAAVESATGEPGKWSSHQRSTSVAIGLGPWSGGLSGNGARGGIAASGEAVSFIAILLGVSEGLAPALGADCGGIDLADAVGVHVQSHLIRQLIELA
jgi:hypothetical protein